MEFFGCTKCGPQNYIKDVMKIDYREPTSDDDVKNILTKRVSNAADIIMKDMKIKPSITVAGDFIKPCHVEQSFSIQVAYRGELNGFAYGSLGRLLEMKKKGIVKPINLFDIYRLPPTSSNEFGWWIYDEILSKEIWYKTEPRYPQPVSPNSLILDKVRKNNKYATLF